MKTRLPQLERYIKTERKRRQWRHGVTLAALAVLLLTTISFIRPAQTLEADSACEILEHTHGEECYADGALVCSLTEHLHGEACFAEAPEAEAGKPDPADPEIPAGPEEPEEPETEETKETEETEETEEEQTEPEEEGPCTFAMERRTPAAEDSRAGTGALDLNDYLKDGVKLWYKNERGDWIRVTAENAGTVPGDADIQLEIPYLVPTLELWDEESETVRELVYDLPAFIRRESLENGLIMSEGKPVGSIRMEEGQLRLLFDEEWVQESNANPEKANYADGTLKLDGKFDLREVEEGTGKEQIVVGDLEVTLDFGADYQARYGDIQIQKTGTLLESTDSGMPDQMEYTLTVSVPEDTVSVPDVSVADIFGSGKEKVDYYIYEQPEMGTVIADGSGKRLSWEIGTMEPGTSVTFTYRVALVDGYLGKKQAQSLENQAAVRSGEYERGRDETSYTASGKMNMEKKGAVLSYDAADGGATLEYSIWVQALPENTYTLDSIRILDDFAKGIDSLTPTEEAIRRHLTYVEGSFALYRDANGDRVADGEAVEFPVDEYGRTGAKITDSEANANFLFYLGDMKPGEGWILKYQVKADAGVFTLDENLPLALHNRAFALVDDRDDEIGEFFSVYSCINPLLTRKNWSRKISGMVAEDMEITDAVPSFSVPKGSVKYQVAVNEDGNWDVSEAEFRDELQGDALKLFGALRVEAYQYTKTNAGLVGEQLIADIRSKGRLAETGWLSIAGNGFTFCPKDIGMPEGAYAYVLTYYAAPNLGTNLSATVTNTFSLDGNVKGPDGTGWGVSFNGTHAGSQVTIHNDRTYELSKESWYVEGAQGAETAIYWVVKVTGDAKVKGLKLRDIPQERHTLDTDFLVGVYHGKPKKDIVEYESVAAWEEAETGGALEKLEAGTDYVCGADKILTLERDVNLEDGTVYVVIKTKILSLPSGTRNAYLYKNDAQVSGDGGSTWGEPVEAQSVITADGSCFKEVGGVYTFDGKTWGVLIPGKTAADRIVKTDLGVGTYVGWQVHVNYDGSSAGRATVTDTLPKGLEPVYVRYYWHGDGYAGTVLPPAAELPDGAYPEEEGWVQKRFEANGDGSVSSKRFFCDYAYHAGDNRLVWEIQNLRAGRNDKDVYAVEFQVLCKVTDEKLLLGGGSTYLNTITVQDERGAEETDTAEVSVSKETLKKEGITPEVGRPYYPFKITVNELGEDLVYGKDKVTLVDEMSSLLQFDEGTLAVKLIDRERTEEAYEKLSEEEWSYVVEEGKDGQVIRLTLPDEKPLLITYSARVSTVPGQTVAISNRAHWEGYIPQNEGVVEVPEFKYTVGSEVTLTEKPRLMVRKGAQEAGGIYLEDAEFTLQQVVCQKTADGFTFAEAINPETGDQICETETTGADGMLEFEGEMMEYNTVYRLTETKAPAGYLLDTTPQYFAFVQKVNGQEPTELQDWRDAGVTIAYAVSSYSYTFRDHKGEAEVEKLFLDKEGQPLEGQAIPDGTYPFGIFPTPQDGRTEAGEEVPRVLIQYTGGVAVYYRSGVEQDAPKFINLELGKTYYIYELDDRGYPIVGNQAASVDGRTFTVSYPDGNTVQVDCDDDGNVAASSRLRVTVSNKARVFALPKTGDMGAGRFRAAGAVLTGLALLGLCYRKKKDNKKRGGLQ